MKKSILLSLSMFLTLSIVTAQSNQNEPIKEVKKVELEAPIGGKIERPTQRKFVKINASALKSAELQRVTKEEEVEIKETNKK